MRQLTELEIDKENEVFKAYHSTLQNVLDSYMDVLTCQADLSKDIEFEQIMIRGTLASNEVSGDQVLYTQAI